MKKITLTGQKRLEESGCRVIYGLDGLKVHSKLCLITYKNNQGVHYISQVGTGNYNENNFLLEITVFLMEIQSDKK